MRKGFTLPELMVATGLGMLLILIIFMSTITIQRVGFQLYKKYSIALSSKTMLNKISKELAKNISPISGQNPIRQVTNNSVEFYSVRIVPNNPNPVPIIQTITVNRNRVNHGISYTIISEERDLNGNRLGQRQSSTFIEAENSNFWFENLQNVAIRIYLLNQFNYRGQGYELYYSIDVPINIQ